MPSDIGPLRGALNHRLSRLCDWDPVPADLLETGPGAIITGLAVGLVLFGRRRRRRRSCEG